MNFSSTAKKALLGATLLLPGLFAWKIVQTMRTRRETESRKADTLLRGTGMDTPDPNQKGNPAYAMQRSGVLMDYLRARNFPNQDNVPREMLTLPDQELSEMPEYRPSFLKAHPPKFAGHIDTFLPAFAIYNPICDIDRPELAFTCDTYLRRNMRVYKDGHYITRPAGFVIVGYRNGTIAQVPPEDIRLIADSNRKESAIRIYPGCAKYRPDLPKESFVDTGKRNTDAIMAKIRSADKEAASAPLREARAYGQKEPIQEPVCKQCEAGR